MKIKLKKGEKLPSNYNYCNLPYDKWVALNQGKTVELDMVPNQLNEKIDKLNSKKGDK